MHRHSKTGVGTTEPSIDTAARVRRKSIPVTAQSNFKKLVRARMEETGENYTTARAALLETRPSTDVLNDPREQAYAEHRTVVDRFMQGGRLTSWPSKRRTRAHLLLHLVTYFEPGRTYTEKQVNEILAALWQDYAFMRREMVEYGYLVRTADASAYCLATRAPDRAGTVLAAEAPAWEAMWLPGYLAAEAL